MIYNHFRHQDDGNHWSPHHSHGTPCPTNSVWWRPWLETSQLEKHVVQVTSARPVVFLPVSVTHLRNSNVPSSLDVILPTKTCEVFMSLLLRNSSYDGKQRNGWVSSFGFWDTLGKGFIRDFPFATVQKENDVLCSSLTSTISINCMFYFL